MRVFVTHEKGGRTYTVHGLDHGWKLYDPNDVANFYAYAQLMRVGPRPELMSYIANLHAASAQGRLHGA